MDIKQERAFRNFMGVDYDPVTHFVLRATGRSVEHTVRCADGKERQAWYKIAFHDESCDDFTGEFGWVGEEKFNTYDSTRDESSN